MGHSDVCWEWQASVHPLGYGRFSYNGKTEQAHRMSALLSGKIQQLKATRDTYVLHKCHNRKCVNPDHLYVGTQKDNVRDMTKAGRSNPRYGEDNPCTKYDNQTIKLIFKLRARGQTCEQMSKQTGVSTAHISNILCGKSRKRQQEDSSNILEKEN